MKDSSLERSDRFVLGFVAVAAVTYVLFFAAFMYSLERDDGVRAYQKVLEGNLRNPDTMNLNQIQAALRQWRVGYEELRVPTSYTNVYKEVETILTEANSLTERFPTMLAPDFQRDLGLLQKRVEALPSISPDLYNDRNSWFAGFGLFVFRLLGILLKMAGFLFLFVALLVGAFYLLGLWLKKATTSTSSADTTSRGGGGSGGSGGYPPPPGMYGTNWGPPPTDSPPRFPW